jgi:hypothetical protein
VILPLFGGKSPKTTLIAIQKTGTATIKENGPFQQQCWSAGQDM